MGKTSGTTLLTEGSIWRKIVGFAIPLFLGNLFQQLYNAADSLIVGNFIGSEALAAVSSSGSLIFLLVGLFNGVAMGAGVVIARYFGANDPENLQAGNPHHHIFWNYIGLCLNGAWDSADSGASSLDGNTGKCVAEFCALFPCLLFWRTCSSAL